MKSQEKNESSLMNKLNIWSLMFDEKRPNMRHKMDFFYRGISTKHIFVPER